MSTTINTQTPPSRPAPPPAKEPTKEPAKEPARQPEAPASKDRTTVSTEARKPETRPSGTSNLLSGMKDNFGETSPAKAPQKTGEPDKSKEREVPYRFDAPITAKKYDKLEGAYEKGKLDLNKVKPEMVNNMNAKDRAEFFKELAAARVRYTENPSQWNQMRGRSYEKNGADDLLMKNLLARDPKGDTPASLLAARPQTFLDVTNTDVNRKQIMESAGNQMDRVVRERYEIDDRQQLRSESQRALSGFTRQYSSIHGHDRFTSEVFPKMMEGTKGISDLDTGHVIGSAVKGMGSSSSGLEKMMNVMADFVPGGRGIVKHVVQPSVKQLFKQAGSEVGRAGSDRATTFAKNLLENWRAQGLSAERAAQMWAGILATMM